MFNQSCSTTDTKTLSLREQFGSEVITQVIRPTIESAGKFSQIREELKNLIIQFYSKLNRGSLLEARETLKSIEPYLEGGKCKLFQCGKEMTPKENLLNLLKRYPEIQFLSAIVKDYERQNEEQEDILIKLNQQIETMRSENFNLKSRLNTFLVNYENELKLITSERDSLKQENTLIEEKLKSAETTIHQLQLENENLKKLLNKKEKNMFSSMPFFKK